ncbi:MAG: hypothetical protein P8J78_00375 [Maricaulis sp.]|nr:hypothetical protein [Maricaulis sp.]MDG2043035.1 hypothetical protein [Maricaulis sp.]
MISDLSLPSNASLLERYATGLGASAELCGRIVAEVDQWLVDVIPYADDRYVAHEGNIVDSTAEDIALAQIQSAKLLLSNLSKGPRAAQFKLAIQIAARFYVRYEKMVRDREIGFAIIDDDIGVPGSTYENVSIFIFDRKINGKSFLDLSANYVGCALFCDSLKRLVTRAGSEL